MDRHRRMAQFEDWDIDQSEQYITEHCHEFYRKNCSPIPFVTDSHGAIALTFEFDAESGAFFLGLKDLIKQKMFNPRIIPSPVPCPGENFALVQNLFDVLTFIEQNKIHANPGKHPSVRLLLAQYIVGSKQK